MIVLKKVVFDRKTGEKLKEEIVEELDMTEDEYYRPLVEVLGDGFLEYWKKQREANGQEPHPQTDMSEAKGEDESEENQKVAG